MLVRLKEADRIAAKASQALLEEQISDGHRQQTRISWQITRLESDLSQSLSADQWSRLDKYYHNTGHRMHQAVKERQTFKFNRQIFQKTQHHPSQPTLDRSKLVINLSSRPLFPMEVDVLALGLSFTIAPRHIPWEEIISATEAMACTLDHKSADTLRLGVSAAL